MALDKYTQNKTGCFYKIIFISTHCPAGEGRRKRKRVMTQQNNENWNEYAKMRNDEYKFGQKMLAARLQKERELRERKTTEDGRFYGGPDQLWLSMLKDYAMRHCKSRKKWQAESVNGTGLDRSRGIMAHKCAQELSDKYQNRAAAAHQTCQNYIAKIKQCDEQIENLENIQQELNRYSSHRARKSVQNKLTHWRGRRVGLENQLAEFEQKEKYFKEEFIKWLGVIEKIKLALIKREICKDKSGRSNKYGFNPNIQSRETATGVFCDFDNYEWREEQ